MQPFAPLHQLHHSQQHHSQQQQHQQQAHHHTPQQQQQQQQHFAQFQPPAAAYHSLAHTPQQYPAALAFGPPQPAAGPAPTPAASASPESRAKCDGQQPVCGYCKSKNKPCTYEREIRKRGPKTGYVDKLHERIKELEAQLSRSSVASAASSAAANNANGSNAGSAPDHGESPPSSVDSNSPGLASVPVKHEPSEILQQHELEWSADPFSMTALPTTSASVSMLRIQNSVHQRAKTTTEIRRDLIDRFFEHIHPHFPVLSRKLFLAGVDTESPLLLNAMYAVALTQPGHPTYNTYNHGEVYYNKARSLLDEHIEVHTCSTVLALVLLCYYAMGCGHGQKSFIFSSMAIKMSLAMGLNNEPSPELAAELSRQDIEFRRRIWFLVYQVDMYVAMTRPDVPSSIRNEDWDVQPPNFEFLFDDGGFTEALELAQYGFSPLRSLLSTEPLRANLRVNVNNFFAQAAALSRIISRIILYMRAVHGTIQTPATFDHELEKSVLDAELHDWFSRQPFWFQNIGDAYCTKFYSVNPPHWAVAHKQVIYHLARIMLHGARIKFDPHTPASLVALDPAFWACVDAAKSIALITKRFMECNPMFSYVGPMIATAVFRSGIIFTVGIQSGYFHGGEIPQVQEILTMLIRALRQISHFWILATVHGNQLQAIASGATPLRLICLGSGPMPSVAGAQQAAQLNDSPPIFSAAQSSRLLTDQQIAALTSAL
ncbi:hypothetical protein HK105_204162 [Polyrhizophydium stewartii]|uniref:Xylanolytic transcriptional activator regulatory domain-containing protein n=1 Tax=Polyrhizophydium stewartii TaxID=2732419 RepID=A0ABR4NA44_9FUNG